MLEFQGRMPRKSCANRARAANLQRNKTDLLPKPTIEVEDEDFPGPDSDSHGCRDAPRRPRQDDIIGDDAELLDIIGCLRGTAMVDDEDESSDSDSECKAGEGEDEEQEIKEISALEQFSDTLQKAHDLALAAERERERGRKRPKIYNKNSNRTKCRCRQRGRELAAKGFHSVKEWFLSKPLVLPMSPANDSDSDTVPTTPRDFQESEESSSEDEICPAGICRSRPCGVPVASHETLAPDDNSESESGSDSETVELWENDGQKTWTPASEESLDPLAEENERLRCRNAVAEMLKDLKAGKVPHDNSPETSTDRGLNQLNYKNLPALR
jgi:hypothetical protein